MKEVIISDEDRSIKRDEIVKKIERLDVYIKRAERRVETHVKELEKIVNKYGEAREMAEEHLAEKGKIDIGL